MKITSIQVRSAATVPHPRIPYANVRPEVMLTAELEHDESPTVAVAELQEQCDNYLADHVRKLTAQLEEVR